MSVIGNMITLRREEKGLSLAELARRTSISKGYLHNLESGEIQSPSADNLFKIANALGTTIADLMDEEHHVSLHSDTDTDSTSLREFADEVGLPESDVEMLAGIRYRGKRPENKEDWRYIYESIKRTLK